MTEEWRAIPGFPDYFVSSLGRIASEKRKHRIIMRSNPSLEAGRIKQLAVFLYGDSGKFRAGIHRMVLLAFRGPCPDGMEGCHNDGDPTNNAVYNLRWDTHISNMADRVKHGTNKGHEGEAHHGCKLTAEAVRCIRAEPQSSTSTFMLMKAFAVSRGQINDIRRGKNWSSVPQYL